MTPNRRTPNIMKHCPLRVCVVTAIVAIVFVSFGSKAQDRGTAPPSRGAMRGIAPDGNAARGGRSGRGPMAPLRAPGDAEMLPARFQATVYEVEASTNQAGALDAKTLAGKAATPETLLKVLSEVAKTRIVHRIDQPVNVFSDFITIGSQEPVIAETRMTNTGEAINSISYQNVGIIVRLSAQMPPKESGRKSPEVTLAVQLSRLVRGNSQTAASGRSVGIRNATLEQSEPLVFNRPLVMLATSTSAPPSEAPPAVFVVRYEFGESGQTASAPAAAMGRVANTNVVTDATTTNPPAEISTNALPAQFQATVYEVRASADQVNTLDAGALTSQAASADSLLKALGESGTSRVLYHFDQRVNVLSDWLEIGTNEMVVAGTTASPTGLALNSYRSQNRGVSVSLSAQAPPKEAQGARTHVALVIQFSTMTPSNVEMGLGPLQQPVVQNQMLQHSEALEFGKPRVLLTVRPSSWGDYSTQIAYVVRYLFNPPGDK